MKKGRSKGRYATVVGGAIKGPVAATSSSNLPVATDSKALLDLGVIGSRTTSSSSMTGI